VKRDVVSRELHIQKFLFLLVANKTESDDAANAWKSLYCLQTGIII
jgi:hypothetical protein